MRVKRRTPPPPTFEAVQWFPGVKLTGVYEDCPVRSQCSASMTRCEDCGKNEPHVYYGPLGVLPILPGDWVVYENGLKIPPTIFSEEQFTRLYEEVEDSPECQAEVKRQSEGW